jgi:hypothetical protein
MDDKKGVPLFRCRQLAWPSPTNRSTWLISKSLAAAPLRHDGGTEHDLASEPHRLSWRILAPASMIEISGSRKRGDVNSALSRAIMASPAFAVSCWHAMASGSCFQIRMHR